MPLTPGVTFSYTEGHAIYARRHGFLYAGGHCSPLYREYSDPITKHAFCPHKRWFFTSEVTSIALRFPRRFCDLPRAFTSEVTSARRIPAQVCVNTQDAESMICALFYFRGHYSSYANRIGLDFQDPLALEESCAYAILYSKDH